MSHPSDRILEQYRIRTLAPVEAKRTETHLAGCGLCQRRYQAQMALHGQMEQLELEEPSADFTGLVMSRLTLAEESPSSKVPPPRSRFILRPELANALVATTATYLFLASGFVGAVFSVDRGIIENQLYDKAQAVMDWVILLSKALQ